MKEYLRNKTYGKKIRQTNYAKVLIGIVIVGLIIFTAVMIFIFPNKIIFFTFLILNITFLLLHMGFLKFIIHAKGLTKAIGVITVCYIDAFLMLTGLLFGSLSYFLRRKY